MGREPGGKVVTDRHQPTGGGIGIFRTYHNQFFRQWLWTVGARTKGDNGYALQFSNSEVNYAFQDLLDG